MTVAEYDELIPPRVIDPVRRRRWLVGALVVAVLAAVGGSGLWWHQSAAARAHARYAKALPAAEAAWPAAKARILAVTPPKGWIADPTGTACAPLSGGVTCWGATSFNAQESLSSAVAVLTAHGATAGDHLRELFNRGAGLSADTGCASPPDQTSVERVPCPVYLTWGGASVQVVAVRGLPEYGVPAGVAIARGPAYPEARQAMPAHRSAPVGSDVAAVQALTGLPSGAVTGLECRIPATDGGCLRWRGTFTDPGTPGELLRDDVRLVAAAGFRASEAGPQGHVAGYLSALLWRYRSPDGADPAMVLLTVHPDGHGGTSGRVTISNGGLPE